MLRSLMGKANNIQDQTCNVSRETETLRIKKKFQKSKTETEMGNALYWLIVDSTYLHKNVKISQ